MTPIKKEASRPLKITSLRMAFAWLYGCCILCYAAAVAALWPQPQPVVAVGAALYALFAVIWSSQMLAHCESVLSGTNHRQATRCSLLFSSAIHGSLWGVVPVLLSPGLSATQLQLYSVCLMLVCVIFSAGVTASSRVVHLFVACAVLPAAYAWVFHEEPARLMFWVALALTWLVSGLVNLRALAVSYRARSLARGRAGAAQALAKRIRLLREAHTAKGRALNVASHEIRQPIHAIGLLVERLRLDPQAWQLRTQIDEIASVVQSVSNALELLLDIARLDAGAVRPNLSAFSIRDFLNRIVLEFEPQAAKKGLRFECPMGAETWVRTDPTLLHSIVSNLVSNAIRYTDHGSVIVNYTSNGPTHLWINVVDTGLGIPEANQDRVFEEFYRVDRENQSTQGFGLGLAIVRRTAQLLRLDVKLESTPAKGSRFSVSVPVADSGAATEAAAPVVSPVASISRTLVGLRGVLVENDQVVLKGMEAMIRTWGCRPLIATGMEDLLAKLPHQEDLQFDFIVADFHLGIGAPTGVQVINALREHARRHVPAALLTGDLNIRSGGSLAADGHIHLLHKPVAPAKLRGVIEAMAAERSDAKDQPVARAKPGSQRDRETPRPAKTLSLPPPADDGVPTLTDIVTIKPGAR